jgi:hypothetical protein
MAKTLYYRKIHWIVIHVIHLNSGQVYHPLHKAKQEGFQ